MNTIKVLIIRASLVVVLIALAVTGYLTYGRLVRKMEALERDLEDRAEVLERVKAELSEANQENAVFLSEKESLNKKIALQQEQIAEIRQAKKDLQKQQEALFAEKQELEDILSEKEQLYQEQVKLCKREGKVKEENFKKQEKKRSLDFIAEKRELKKQIKAAETKLEESVRKNQELLSKLTESSQMVTKLKLEKGGENNQSDLSGRKDEQFREEALKLHYNTGLAYDQNRQFDLALVEYEKALAIAPDDADVHYNLAILCDEHLGDKKKAIEHYRAYLELRPDAKDKVKVNYWIKEAQKELKWETEKLSKRSK